MIANSSDVTSKKHQVPEKGEVEIVCELTGDCSSDDEESMTRERGPERGLRFDLPSKRFVKTKAKPSATASHRTTSTSQRSNELGLDNTTFLPWPPPRPASMSKLRKIIKGTNYRDTIEEIELRLRSHGYRNFRYFAVPEGIGLVTQIERIGPGKIDPLSRWGYGSAKNVNSFSDYIKALFLGSKGQYFVAVILLVDGEVLPDSDPIRLEDVERWRSKGEFAPAERRASRPLSPSTGVWLLNYEFSVTQGAKRSLVAERDGALDFDEHASRLGLK